MTTAATAEIETADDILERYASTFVLLARRKSRGEQISEEEIATACADARREPTEFHALSGRLIDRNRIRKLLAKLDHLREQRDDLLARRKELSADADEYLAEYHRKHGDLSKELALVEDRLADGATLPAQLFQGCPDEGLRRRHTELHRAVERAAQAVIDAQRHLEHQRLTHHDDPEIKAGRVERAEAAVGAAATRRGELAAELSVVFKAMIDF